jgi:drug/metabolite transporter (DMT)-like permease
LNFDPLIAFFVLTRIVANPLSNVFQKKLTGQAADPLWVILFTHLLLTLVALPVLLFGPHLHLSGWFWVNILICVCLAVAGNVLIVAALKSTDLSVLGPINAYKSIVSLVLGFFLLGEFPTWLGLAGILLILAGSYFILDEAPSQPGQNLFVRFITNRGVILRFAALILSATDAIFLKKALLVSSPLITFLFWCLLGLPVACLAAAYRLRGRFQRELAVVNGARGKFLLLATTTGLMQLSTLYTFGALQVGVSLALFQTSTLLSVFFGYHFFQEQNLARRLLGAGIMVLGAILIVVFGSPA